MKLLTLLFLTVALASAGSAQASSNLANIVMKANGNGSVESPKDCSPRIGSGGNYVQGKRKLSGKCENGGIPPALSGTEGDKFLVFKTLPSGSVGNSRSELAGPMLPFEHTARVSFLFRIPVGAPENPSGQMFYPLQIWQCAPLAPIAGIRVSHGKSHEINFLVRHQNKSSPTIATLKLKPGHWTRIELDVTPSLDPLKGGVRVLANGRTLTNWKGAFGSDPGLCESPANSEEWRIKFGIYRTPNKERTYEVHFDDLKVELITDFNP